MYERKKGTYSLCMEIYGNTKERREGYGTGKLGSTTQKNECTACVWKIIYRVSVKYVREKGGSYVREKARKKRNKKKRDQHSCGTMEKGMGQEKGELSV